MTLQRFAIRSGKCEINTILGPLAYCFLLAHAWSFDQKNEDSKLSLPPNAEGRGHDAGVLLADDVTKPFGIYHYQAQEGIYQNVTAGEVAEDFLSAVLSVGSVVRNLNSYAGWANSNGDLRWSIGAGAGSGVPIGIAAGLYGEYYQGQQSNRLDFALGPISIDNIWAGYGLIYNDVNGPTRIESYAEDDKIGDIVWLSARTSLVFGNFAFSAQPFIYWLPQTGEVGWGMPGPFAAMFGGAALGAQGMAQVVWAKEFGRWRLTAYDMFTPQLPIYNIGQAAGNWGNGVRFGDLTPIDRIGRYGLGVGAGDTVQNFNPSLYSQTGRNRYRTLYLNSAGINAYCDHTSTLQSMYYLNRLDMWGGASGDRRTIINGGAAIKASDGSNQAFTGYEFQSGNPFDQFFHTAYAGAGKQLGPDLYAYGLGRYIWITGSPGTYQTYGGAIGIRHQLDVNTMQALEAGRGVFNPGNQRLGIEDYILYYIGHQLGPRSRLIGFAGMSNRRQDFVTENDTVVKYCGLRNEWRADRTTLFAQAVYQDIEIEPARQWTSRIYSAGASYLMSETVTSQCFYQYEDTRGTQEFTEHSLFIGIAKQF